MTIEEAVLVLKRYQGYEPMEYGNILKHSFDLTDETVDTLLSAIRTETAGEPLTHRQKPEVDITTPIPLDRLRELAEADRDGRCVVLPDGGCTDKDGENALKSAMNTVFYYNNPVTRYIADAVAEKLTREAAKSALKGENHEANPV